MKKFLWLILVTIVALPLMGASCITFKSVDKEPTDGGVFISRDKGKEWTQKTYIRTVDKNIETISKVNVLEMIFDPHDSRTIYLITEFSGTYVTYNSGEKWDSFYSQASRVYDIKIDPSSRNIIYITLGNRIIKTTDGGDVWDEIYFEATGSVSIKTIAIDHEDTDIVYLGATDGRLIRSADAGKTWSRMYDFEQDINKILINPNDASIIYIATTNGGVLRSGDRGKKWNNISLGDDPEERANLLQKYPGIDSSNVIIFDQTQEDAILIGTHYGLLKNKNGGADWEAIRLLTEAQKINVISVAVNPQDNKEIYYGINNALYFSKDGGKNWAARSLPTGKMARHLMVDPIDPNIVYLGVYAPPPPPENDKMFLR